MNNSMLLITATWGDRKTFKMIPASIDCPYNEAIYDPTSKVLALISKEKKQSLHMMAKLNEWGDVVPMRVGKRSNGKEFAEERKTLETYYEYYIENAEEIKAFVQHTALNSDQFNFTQHMEEQQQPKQILTNI